MSRVLNAYATPFVTWFFVISLVTGVALFFHVGPTAFRGIHEWLSLVLILPFALHLWKNWRPMMCYLKHAPMAVALAVSLAMSVPFFLASGGDRAGGPPAMRFAASALAHPAEDLAPLFGTDAQALRDRLTAAGYAFATPDQPLADVAAAAGKTTNELLAVLMAPGG
ncbi:MAG: DUF4405 domain-containing protein [Fuscovulum sp.]|jgi:hypothetical protein|nr:DUF4405 domain-containing protein [Fuscovulum sp.]